MPLFGKKKKSNAKKVTPKKTTKTTRKGVKGTAPRKATEKITPNKPKAKAKTGVEVKKTHKSEVKVIVPEKESTGKRVYHVAKRSDGKWAVKFAGGEKVIKLFDTQVEALEYTKKMTKNQGGAMLVHNSKGKNKGRIQ